MEIHQLRTFVCVAKLGSITRASEQLYLSQPAVSGHIKSMEDTLGLALFERTPKGMSLTSQGQAMLSKAEVTLDAHQKFLEEARRIKQHLTGRLRIGAGGHSSTSVLSKLLAVLSEQHPEVEVVLSEYGSSGDILEGIKSGRLDAGFYNEAGTPDPLLDTVRVGQFGIYVASAKGKVKSGGSIDWGALAEFPWICPSTNTCCGKAAETLFRTHQFRPKKMIVIERETVTRSLIEEGVGIGLLHADSALEAQAKGKIDLVCEAEPNVKILFACLATRATDPVIRTAKNIMLADHP